MEKHFRRGIGSALQGIVGISANYFDGLRDENDIRSAYAILAKLEEFYEGIMFDTLVGRYRFQPLFEVKGLLPKLRESMDNIFVEKSAEDDSKVKQCCDDISRSGLVFREHLRDLLEQARANPGMEKFTVNTTHLLKGDNWTLIPYVTI